MVEKLVVGNWKMYPTLPDSLVLAASLRNHLSELKGVQVALAPPLLSLIPIIESWRHRAAHIHFAAQNVAAEDQGAHTGEVSAYMLRSLVSYAIVGHSERRAHQHEDNDLINGKVHACLRWRVRPILCVGEAKRMIDENGRLDSYQWAQVAEQLMEGLSGVSPDDLGRVIIAYEPVWAVGTKRPASSEYILDVLARLKAKLREKYSIKAIEEIRFIYGGSVEPSNAVDYLKYPEIQGLLPGGVSVKAREFTEVCRLASQAAR